MEESQDEHCQNELLNELPDIDLWQRWKRGDEASFRELIRRYSDLVWSVCRRLLFRDQDSEDAFQITFLTLFRCGDQITGEAFGPWIRRVAYHASLQIRDRKIQAGLDEQHEMDNFAEPVEAFDRIEQVERQLNIEAAINALPDHLYEPLVQFYFEGRTRSEIANICGIPKSKVKSRLQQARQKLREQLVRRGLGASTLLAILGLTEFAKAATPLTLVEKTVVNLNEANRHQGLSIFNEQTTLLERKLNMSNHSLGLLKGTAIFIATAIAVSLLSFMLNSSRQSNAGVSSTVVSAAQANPQADRQQPLTFSTASRRPNARQLVSSVPQAVEFQATSSVSNLAEYADGQNGNSNDREVINHELAGIWSNDDAQFEFDPESHILRVSFSFPFEQPFKVSATCEYREMGDLLVGVIIHVNLDVSDLSLDGDEMKALTMGLPSKFSDQPFMLRLKPTKSSLFVRDIQLGFEAMSSELDISEQVAIFKGPLLGEFKREK